MPTNTSNPSKNKAAGKLPPGRELPAGFFPLDRERKKALAAFQRAAGVKFKSQELLNLSFVHRSVSNETDQRINNERLEFLGDAVLGAVTATLLYREFADKREGELAKIKSAVVSEDILSGVARELQIDSLLLLGRGEEHSGGRTKSAILADALEALVGAFYLDSGYRSAFSFVETLIAPEIRRVLENRHHRDYKSLLQELTQRLYRTYPLYRILKRSGPEHERLFCVEVQINREVYGPGMGRNKKSAEQEAAKLAWEALRDE
jgi:ribonuclease-3